MHRYQNGRVLFKIRALLHPSTCSSTTAGVYIIFFFFLLLNIDCGYSLEPPHHNLCFEQKQEKHYNFSPENYRFYSREKLHNLTRHVMVLMNCGEKNTLLETVFSNAN